MLRLFLSLCLGPIGAHQEIAGRQRDPVTIKSLDANVEGVSTYVSPRVQKCIGLWIGGNHRVGIGAAQTTYDGHHHDQTQ